MPDGRIGEILESVGLAHRGGHLPSQLSGGEMQRVAVGRALAGDPEIILADEPTANLDTENGLAIFELLRGLAARGITVVVVTHNPELAARTARVIRLRDGSLARVAAVARAAAADQPRPTVVGSPACTGRSGGLHMRPSRQRGSEGLRTQPDPSGGD